MALPLVFFLVYGASTDGLDSMQAGDAPMGGILAIAAVVGMFSKQAIDKLADVFDALLKSDTSEKMKGKDSLASGEKKDKNKGESPDENKVSIPEDPTAVG